MEESMSGVDKKRLLTVVVVLACVFQAVVAGAVYLSRDVTQRELVSGQASLQLLMKRLNGYQAALARPADVETSSESQLLAVPDVVATLQVLQRLGDDAGVWFDSQDVEKSEQPGKQPYMVTGRATPHQLCAFIAGIESSNRLIIIEQGRVTPASEKLVAFELGLATYHRTEAK
jgi:hypothetical protein